MTLTAYDASMDPLAGINDSGIARLGQSVVASDTLDFNDYLVLTVVVAGNIKFLPPINDNADPITITAAPVGFIIPWQVRRLFSTGTTAVLRTIEKVF